MHSGQSASVKKSCHYLFISWGLPHDAVSVCHDDTFIANQFNYVQYSGRLYKIVTRRIISLLMPIVPCVLMAGIFATTWWPLSNMPSTTTTTAGKGTLCLSKLCTSSDCLSVRQELIRELAPIRLITLNACASASALEGWDGWLDEEYQLCVTGDVGAWAVAGDVLEFGKLGGGEILLRCELTSPDRRLVCASCTSSVKWALVRGLTPVGIAELELIILCADRSVFNKAHWLVPVVATMKLALLRWQILSRILVVWVVVKYDCSANRCFWVEDLLATSCVMCLG